MYNIIYHINVIFDTPDGFLHKIYVRNSWQKVVKLLDSFDVLVYSVNISTRSNHVKKL